MKTAAAGSTPTVEVPLQTHKKTFDATLPVGGDQTIISGETPQPLPSRPTFAPSGSASSAASPTSYPARIIIIRHGEKPNDPTDPGLTAQGQARAEALATILPERYPNISYVFAAAPSKASDRPLLTITPTAKALGLPINTDYKDADYDQLAQELLHNPQYAGKTIAICWHHGEIPQLAQALGVTPPQDPWPGKVFDRIWQIDYSPDGQATVQNLPQEALPGDSTT